MIRNQKGVRSYWDSRVGLIRMFNPHTTPIPANRVCAPIWAGDIWRALTALRTGGDRALPMQIEHTGSASVDLYLDV